jgi:hypothetical protein
MVTYQPKPCSRTAPAILSVLGLVTTLGACSGDGWQVPANAVPASGADPDAAPAPAAAPAWLNSPAPDNGAGIWLGSLSRHDVVVNTASCLITEAGEIACVFYEAVPQVTLASDPIVGVYGIPPTATGGAHGTVRLADTSNMSGSGTLYAAPGDFLSDGNSTVAPFTITDGYLTDINGTSDDPNQKRLDLTISSLGEVSTLRATFDHYYYRERHGDINNDWIEGVYATFAIFNDPASLSIDADDSMFSQSAAGCVLSGRFDIIDSLYNAYAADLTMANCDGLTGDYTGLAFLNDFVYVNGTDNLLIAVFSETSFISGEARKYSRPLQ